MRPFPTEEPPASIVALTEESAATRVYFSAKDGTSLRPDIIQCMRRDIGRLAVPLNASVILQLPYKHEKNTGVKREVDLLHPSAIDLGFTEIADAQHTVSLRISGVDAQMAQAIKDLVFSFAVVVPSPQA